MSVLNSKDKRDNLDKVVVKIKYREQKKKKLAGDMDACVVCCTTRTKGKVRTKQYR